MKKTIIFISFALFMGVSLSSFAAYTSTYASVGMGGSQTDTDSVTVPTCTTVHYSLYGEASVETGFGDPGPYPTAGFYSSLSSSRGNYGVGGAVNMYNPYLSQSTSGDIDPHSVQYDISLYSYATCLGIAYAYTGASVSW